MYRYLLILNSCIFVAQLNLLLKRPLEPKKYQQIKKLKDKCHNLINTVRKVVEIPNEEYAKSEYELKMLLM